MSTSRIQYTGASDLTLSLLEIALPSLTAEELEELKRGADHAETLLKQQHLLLNGLGCLIAEDGQDPAGAGNFQSASEVAELLWLMAELNSNARAHLDVVSMAERQLASIRCKQAGGRAR